MAEKEEAPGAGARKAPGPGRPTMMGEIELELDRWIEGGRSAIRAKLKTETKSKAAIARALRVPFFGMQKHNAAMPAGVINHLGARD